MVSFRVWCGYYLHLRLTVREYPFGDWRKNSDKRDEKGLAVVYLLATFPRKHYATGCAFTKVASQRSGGQGREISDCKLLYMFYVGFNA